MKLPTNYSFTNHMHIHFNVCKQMINSEWKYLKPFNCVQKIMSSDSFKNVINKICLRIIYF